MKSFAYSASTLKMYQRYTCKSRDVHDTTPKEVRPVCAPVTAIFSIDTDVCSTGHSQSQEYANERAAWINPRCVQVPEISHEF